MEVVPALVAAVLCGLTGLAALFGTSADPCDRVRPPL